MPTRSRPSPELMQRLYSAKAELHSRRALMSLREKVALVLELQRLYLPLLQRRRELNSWEQPWNVEP